MPRAKVGGLRSTLRSDEQPEKEATALPARKAGKVQFRSKAANFRVSIKRRAIKVDPSTGERYEVVPETAAGTPFDQVKFEENYFETSDLELAAALKDLPMYGMPSAGGEFWDVEEQRQAQDAAEVEELKRRLQARPDLAQRVFKPGTAEDFVLPEQPPA